MFHSRTARRETQHTLGLVEPHLTGAHRVLDLGCGSGYVAWQLARRFPGEVATVDIGDFRRVPTPGFTLFDGTALPFPDDHFDVVMLAFVLHHLPDVYKPLLLAEARRVARQRLLVLEDTPHRPLDRLASWWHGRRFRASIGSREDFGFLDRRQWTSLFQRMGLRPRVAQPLSRWCRSRWQPFARSFFVLEVDKRA